MLNFAVFILLLGPVLCTGTYQRYDSFKVLRIVPKDQSQLEAIIVFQQQNNAPGQISFWLEPSSVNRPIDVMISPENAEAFRRFLSERNMQSEVLIENVQNLVDEQKSHIDMVSQNAFKFGDDPSAFPIDQYHSFEEIYNWVDSLVAKYPGHVSTQSIGNTFEKRDMRLVKIGTGGADKPGYFLEAGIHAREWITVSTIVYIINELTTKYDSNPAYKELVDNVNFYILPSINPDGYEYSRSKNRMWRKNRSGPHNSAGEIGVDQERNFDYHWLEPGSRSSPVPSSETFAGPKPFSEIENVNVANFLGSNNKTLKAFVGLHSYSDLFMYPYGYKRSAYPADVEELEVLANKAAAALKAVHGTTFEVGSPPDVIYAAAGLAMDWAKGVANIKYTYTLELRPGDGDPDDEGQRYGFALPPKFIIPVAEETWASLQVIAKHIITA